MKYNLFLKCSRCAKESIKKEYDKSDSEIDKIMKIGQRALTFSCGSNPRYLICPYCGGVMTVKMMKEAINEK